MVERFVSEPLELPRHAEDEPTPTRVDLIFYGVDHSGSSYEARVFLDAPDADLDTPREDEHYAGSFHVFGHGGCFGDEGHCDVSEEPRDPFDYRPPHQLTPATKVVTITDALSRLVDLGQAGRSVTVTVVAETPGDRPNDVLAFDCVRIAIYA